jgi:hypothetical protein
MALVISSSEDRRKIKAVFDEISNSMVRIEAERDYIKEAISELSKNHELPKKILNRMARIYHKQNFIESVAENDDLETLYENVIHSG